MNAPLSGIRVLDFGMAAVGPISAEYLGWLGADVIKIESPSGDMVRRGKGGPDWAGHTFNGNNISKRGIILDLKKDEDRETALELAKTADVLLENFRSPAILTRLGLGWEKLHEVNPRLIYLQSSAFGPVGPLDGKPSVEWVTQAYGGTTSLQGPEGGPPEFSRGTSSLDWNGAMVNTEAMLIALYIRARTGQGMRVFTSQFQSTLIAGTTRIAEYLATNAVPARMGSARANIVPDQAFQTSDGWITVTALHDRMWQQLCAAIGRADLAADAKYATVASRVEHRAVLVPSLAETFKTSTSAEWVERLRGAKLPVGDFQRGPTLADSLLANPQVQAERMVDVLQMEASEFVSALPHWHFDKTETGWQRPAPAFGEHQDEVMAEIKAFVPPAPTPVKPLEGLALSGLKVVDFSQGVSGPLAGMQLGDLGADVIKVEPPLGDWLRQVPPFQGGEGALFLQLNRNKRAAAVDLKTPEGMALAKKLVANADIVVEGYRPGVMARLGLDYATLSKDNPRLIYCSISGNGVSGPLADQPATELDVQAAVGANRHLGVIGEPPLRFGYDQASISGGMSGVQGILAALVWREKSGLGQHVEVSLLGSEVGVYQWSFTAERHPNDRISNAFTGLLAAPDHGYETADGPVYISNFRDYDTGWVPFLKGIGRGELLEDPRFGSREAILAYLDDVREEVNNTIRDWPWEKVAHVVEDEVGGMFARMLDAAGVVTHPQTEALGAVQTITHPVAGDIRVLNYPWLFDNEIAALRTAPPLLGQHTAEIAREAGLNEAAIEALTANGTFVSTAVPQGTRA
ncbi:MAG: CoA transferase [Chloroflexi bacterium]|nr:CoA transferase [Chloroflexota bacterium]